MEIPIKPLLANKFERFGTVIDIKNSQPLIINSGTTNAIIFNNIKAKVIKLSFTKKSNITFPIYF